MFRRSLAVLLALILGIGAATLVACGQSNGLLSSGDARQIKGDVDGAGRAVDDGNCTKAANAVDNARQDVNALPRTTDGRIVRRLNRGLDALSRQAADACAQTATQETTPAESVPTDTTTTDTTTTDTTTDTTTTTTTTPPTDTTTTPPTDTTPTPPTDTAPTTPTTGGTGGTGGDGTGGASLTPTG
jgi:cell division septation protein DedD